MDDNEDQDICVMAIGVDSFPDLLRGKIDIIEYLNSSGPGSVNGSSENIFDDESRTLSKMDSNALLLGAGVQSQQQHHHQQQHQLHHQQQQNGQQPHLAPPPPRLHHHAQPTPMLHTTNAGIGRPNGNAAPVYAAQHAGHHRGSQDRTPSFDQHVVRLPDSPPETDSGAGSAGSPSGSEASPYSPEFQQQFHHRHSLQHLQHHHNGPGGHIQGSVIHPPVGAMQAQQTGLNNAAAGSSSSDQTVSQRCQSSADVILNVHGLDHLTQSVVTDYLPVQLNARVPNHANGHWPNGSDYFSIAAMTSGQNSGSNENVAGNSRQLGGGQQQTSPAVTTPVTPNPNYTPYVLPALHASPYANDGNNRKRARTENGAAMVKPEPISDSPTGRVSEEDSIYYDDTYGGHQQQIRFTEFQKEQWYPLCNSNGREMQPLQIAVVADKGFNYSHSDTAFVNQKKNHFQVSVHIEVRDPFPPKFVRIPESNTLKPVVEFQLDFYGVKAELLSSYIHIKQSQTDRKPVCYEPVKLDLPPSRVTKVTVARLHFSETTMNNQRKNGRPNPDQKFFYLVASLNAVVQGNEKYMIAAYSSERVIVRASNPGQFDNGESEVHWQKAQSPGSIFHPGPVGVGTDKPTTALSVTGDISCTGTVYHPSDARLKQNIQELNCAEALSKLSQLRVVQYEIRPEIAEQWGLSNEERHRVGVIAQELEEVIPDAVRMLENGDYLTVDDNRIFYESAAAVKELCRLTGNLEYKIEEVEKISKKLSRLSYLRRLGSLRSTDSVNSKPPDSACGSYFSCSRTSVATSTPPPTRKDKPFKNEKVEEPGEDVKFRDPSNRKHKHHHHHHHHCHCRRFSGGERGPCNNKMIQTTVIILVIVMAFCLLSMATLYVLDWHKRNAATPIVATSSSSSGHQQSGRDGTSTVSTGGGKSGSGVGLMKLDQTPRPPPLIPPYHPWPLHPAPYKQPTPLHSACVRLPCEEFCCPNSYTYYNIDDKDSNAGSQGGGNENPTIIVTAEQGHDMSVWQLPPVGTNFQNKLVNMVNTKLNQFRRHESSPSVQADVAADGPENTPIRVEKRRTKLDYVSPGVGRQSSSETKHWRAYDAPSKIKILTLNETIDTRYCLENTCADPKRGNFTYYVPISKYMPHIPLEIQFEIDNKQLIQYCMKWTGEYCYGVEEAYNDNSNDNANQSPKSEAGTDVHPRQTGTWELPVGTYQTSTYRFRLGKSTTVCSSPEDEAGVTFVEYNIHFFRTCL